MVSEELRILTQWGKVVLFVDTLSKRHHYGPTRSSLGIPSQAQEMIALSHNSHGVTKTEVVVVIFSYTELEVVAMCSTASSTTQDISP